MFVPSYSFKLGAIFLYTTVRPIVQSETMVTTLQRAKRLVEMATRPLGKMTLSTYVTKTDTGIVIKMAYMEMGPHWFVETVT